VSTILGYALHLSLGQINQLGLLLSTNSRKSFGKVSQERLRFTLITRWLSIEGITNNVPDGLGMDHEIVDAIERSGLVKLVRGGESFDDVPS
jgi:hypothetical protein